MNEQFVIDFLKQLKLKPSKNMREFWRELEYGHSQHIVDTLKRAVANRIPGSTTNEIYTLKNQSLKLSLDFARYSADLYRRFFDWLVLRPQPGNGRWLDVGCDNGIVTCFIAALFPSAQVVGVDIEENAISCAVELASQLGLTNVAFMQCDIGRPDALLTGDGFDHIVSVRSFHEMIGEMTPPKHYWTTRDLIDESGPTETLELLQIVRGLLRDEASDLITFERLPRLSTTAVWASKLYKADLYVDWGNSGFIQFHEVGEHQKMPVLVCGGTPVKTDILQGVYGLYDVEAPKELAIGTEYMDDLAETIFYHLEDKQFLSGIQINFPNTEKMRYEMWRTERFLTVYQYTNLGNRKLNVLSHDNLPNVTNDFQVTIPSYYQNQDLQVETYQLQRNAT